MRELPSNQHRSGEEIQHLIHHKFLDALQDIDRLIQRHEPAPPRKAAAAPKAGIFRWNKYLWPGGTQNRGCWLDWFPFLRNPRHRRRGKALRQRHTGNELA